MTELTDAQLAAILTDEQLKETENLALVSDGLRWFAVLQIINSHRALAARLAEAEWITCGVTYTDPEAERITEAMRRDQGFSTGKGCKRRLKIKYAFRCVECGRWFDRECIVQHFAEHGDDLRNQLATAQATVAEMTTALEAYADDTNWSYGVVSFAGEDEEPLYYWSRGGDQEPWSMAEAALAPPAPEADDAAPIVQK